MHGFAWGEVLGRDKEQEGIKQWLNSVHGGRRLQGKKPGRYKFSVIFGVGSKKYRTSVVKEPTGNPDWNEESVIPVQISSDNVFFTVTEKDDVLGQVQIPITSLQTTKGHVRKLALKPHKKCPVPQGDLIFQSPALPHRQMKRDSKDLSGEKEEKRKSSTLANFNKKLSKSIHDIFHLGRFGNHDDDEEKTMNLNSTNLAACILD
ncbi:hypothetical protein C0Q70_00388 [Pomacea canaliculata]|uniref:C2 domain-containing protein n=1 Tax=Pomacea canaliculata TaxID=400727 RepID=A0A2T7PWM0_POMCA|nr:hypothetical protein C0Q70_00388 [Pomacea canaliculata]